MRTKYRAIVLGLLLVTTIGVCVQYAGADRWAYPTPSEIDSNPEGYDGETVLLFADVEHVNGLTGQLHIEQYPYRADIETIDRDVIEQLGPGARIQVYGTLRDRSQLIVAEEIVVDTRGSEDREYLYVTSILGALIAAGVFFRLWRFDPRTVAFEPRGDD